MQIKNLMSTKSKFDYEKHWFKYLDENSELLRKFNLLDSIKDEFQFFVDQRIEFDNAKNDVITQ